MSVLDSIDAALAANDDATAAPAPRTIIRGRDMDKTVTGPTLDSRRAGWDSYEYAGRDGLAVQANGEAALWFHDVKPAWHALGTYTPDAKTAAEALQLAGLDWSVTKRQATYTKTDGTIIDVPGKFWITRDDTEAPFGPVGNYYQPVQNVEQMDFLDALANPDDEALRKLAESRGHTFQPMRYESAGAIGGGERVFVSMDLPEHMILDVEGSHDVLRVYVVAMNSHDGTTPFRVMVTPWRPVCRNTLRFGARDALSSWTVRHTSGAKGKIAEARRTLGLTYDFLDEYRSDAETLIRAQLTAKQTDAFLADIFPVAKDATDRQKKAAEERQAHVRFLINDAKTQENIRGTAWGALNAVGEYLDWVTPLRPSKTITEDIARGARTLDVRADDVKTRAKERLLLLVGGGTTRK